MADQNTTTEEVKPAVTFIDEPGGGAFDDMFGSFDEPREEAGASGAFGFEEEDDDDPATGEGAAGEGEADAGQPSAETQALLDRLASLEATNATLQSTLSGLTAKQQTEVVQGLIAKYRDAVQYGNDDEAAALEAQIMEAKAAAPQAAPEQGGVTPELQAAASAWLSKQAWYGVDAAKTLKLKEVAGAINPAKFATPEAYIAEVEKQVLGTKDTTQQQAPQPHARQRQAPGGGVPASAPKAGAPGEVTSVKQLRGKEREAALTAMRVGGLDEKTYLANYNAVRRQQAKRNRK